MPWARPLEQIHRWCLASSPSEDGNHGSKGWGACRRSSNRDGKRGSTRSDDSSAWVSADSSRRESRRGGSGGFEESVDIFDIGSPQGFVTDLVEIERLGAELARGPLHLDERLGHAHEQRVFLRFLLGAGGADHVEGHDIGQMVGVDLDVALVILDPDQSPLALERHPGEAEFLVEALQHRAFFQRIDEVDRADLPAHDLLIDRVGRLVRLGRRPEADLVDAGEILVLFGQHREALDRKSTRLNFSHQIISYAVFCLKKKKATTLSLLSSSSSP